MGGYHNFLLRMNAGGKSVREEQIENAKAILAETFADDPSYIPDGIQVWQSDRVIHPRLYTDRYRSTSPAQANFQTLNRERVYLGDVIPWPEHGMWLVTHTANLHGIQWYGTMSFCNYHVRFHSPLTKAIVTYPVSLINSTQYGSGEKDRYDNELHIRIGTSQMIMYMSYDKHTCLIDSGFRFLVDRNPKMPTVFHVTQADMVSYSDADGHGYIHFTIEEDQFNPLTDNKWKSIADFIPDPVGSAKELESKEELWL